jgi:hypothetical protein
VTARRRARRWPWLVLGAAGTASLALGLAGAAAQEGGTVVIGLDAVAASDGIGSTFGDPSAQPYPVAAGQIAHTEAALSTGPSGYALASAVWPGPLVANAGSLAVLLGGPPEAGQANYSGRAEAFSPAGPNDAELAGMRAHAEGGEAEATAGAEDLEGEPGAATGDVATRSYTSFEAGVLRSVSSCTASDLGFGDGAVTIGSVRTEAEATTDGAEGTAGGRTVVSGMQVGGQDATVDEDGVRFTDPVVEPVGEQVLANLGMDMFVASPRTTQEGSSASHRAGSLVVVWEPPESGQLFIYSICGSDAAVGLRSGMAYVPQGVPAGPGVAPPAVPGSTEPFVRSPEVASPPASDAPAADRTSPGLRAAPIGFARELSIWPYVAGVIAVLAAGIGLGKAREAALVPRAAAVACPLEGARP